MLTRFAFLEPGHLQARISDGGQRNLFNMELVLEPAQVGDPA